MSKGYRPGHKIKFPLFHKLVSASREQFRMDALLSNPESDIRGTLTVQFDGESWLVHADSGQVFRVHESVMQPG